MDVRGSYGVVNHLCIWSYEHRIQQRSEMQCHTSSAPNALTTAPFFPEVLATTRHPIALAICMASDPVDDEPPLTKTLCSGSSCARCKSAVYAVMPVSARPAASTKVRSFGFAAKLSAGTAAYSHNAPSRR